VPSDKLPAVSVADPKADSARPFALLQDEITATIT